MPRPTIFFSHAAQDADLLVALKATFCQRTHEVFDVFLSSDGSSMPFGHYWQKTIEEALLRAKLMFTFLSAASVNSRWIYFESGFAHAKGVRVVPVALEGLDLETQPAPLQLLQGFNLRNYQGLNNLIEIANQVFDQAHPLSFRESDYTDLAAKARLRPSRALGRYTDRVESVVLAVKCRDPQDAWLWLQQYAAMPGAESLVSNHADEIEPLGLRIWCTDKTQVNFCIDSLAIDRVYPTIQALILMSSEVQVGCDVRIWFSSSVHERESNLRRSASLIGTHWGPRGRYYAKRSEDPSRSLSFEIRWHEDEYYGDDDGLYALVEQPGSVPALADLKEVIDLCFERDLLVDRAEPARRE